MHAREVLLMHDKLNDELGLTLIAFGLIQSLSCASVNKCNIDDRIKNNNMLCQIYNVFKLYYIRFDR